VSAGEGEPGQVPKREPARRGLAGNWVWPAAVRKADQRGFEGDAISGDGMFHRAEGYQRVRAKSQYSARSGAEAGFGLGQFHVGEFPEPCVHDSRRSPPNQEITISFHHVGGESPCGGSRTVPGRRKLGDAVLPKGDAELPDGAARATGLPGCADQRAEFHQGLIEIATRKF